MSAIGNASTPVHVNERSVAKEGNAIPAIPDAGRLIEKDGGKFHVKVDSSLKNTDGSVKSTDFVGIGTDGQLVERDIHEYIGSNDGGDTLREILTNYQHLPYVSSEANIDSYGITLSVHSDTDVHEYTVPCDSILRISAIPSRSGDSISYSTIKYDFEIYNTLSDGFVKFYTPNCAVFNFEQRQNLAPSTGYFYVATTIATDKINFYIQAGSRIRYRKVTTSGWDVDITAVLVPIIKYNQITTKKFIPDCNVLITPSTYTCIVSPSMNQFSNDTVIDGETVPAYRGRQLKPQVTVLDNTGNTLIEDVDYTVAYGTNTMMSSVVTLDRSGPTVYPKRDFTRYGTVVVIGKGEWTSSKTLNFPMTYYDYITPAIYAVAYKTYSSAEVLGAAIRIGFETSKLPATVKFEGGSYTDNQTLDLGGSAASIFTTTGKKYYRLTYSDGTTERSYLEL